MLYQMNLPFITFSIEKYLYIYRAEYLVILLQYLVPLFQHRVLLQKVTLRSCTVTDTKTHVKCSCELQRAFMLKLESLYFRVSSRL